MPPASLSRRTLVFGTLPGLAISAMCAKAATGRSVATLAALRAVRGVDGEVVAVTAAGVGGRFRWDSRAFAVDDGVLAIAPAGGGRGRWIRDISGGLDVRWFGAAANASAAVNTAAFSAAGAAISRASGGTVLIPSGTYRVGIQRRARGNEGRFVPDDVLRIEGCRTPVAILGRGATLKATNGLRFGAFNPRTAAAHPSRMPFVDPEYRADAPTLIHVEGCSGPVRIEGVTLNGNASNYMLGGGYGDLGRQVGGDGILSVANTGGVTISDVISREHGRDGIMIVHHGLRPDSPRYPVTLTDVICDRNGRQGLSWVGGTGLTATRCKFTRTGRGKAFSAPGAGVDIEAEDSVCRNGRFVQCEFVDNLGAAMVADSGDSADVRFDRCTFIGTTSWSAWPRKPRFVFRDCLFVGSIVAVFGSPNPADATQFHDCRFYGDPALSPTRQVYGAYLADLGGGATNVLMRNCDFRAIAPGIALPWTLPDIRFDNCRFSQKGTGQSYPRGIFTGINRMDSAGPVGLDGSEIRGRLILNGRPFG